MACPHNTNPQAGQCGKAQPLECLLDFQPPTLMRRSSISTLFILK